MKTINNILNSYIFFYNNNLLFLDNRISNEILITFNNCLKFFIVNLIYNHLIYSYTITKMLYYL